MAVAEARAAWQRTANRCLVQEDAKRAPKLACCPSVSSSVKQVDGGPSVNERQDTPGPGFLPPHRGSSYANLSPDSRWWLYLQPNHGYQQGLINEQLSTLETEMENSGTSKCAAIKFSGAYLQNEDNDTCTYDSAVAENLFDSQSGISATCMNEGSDIGEHQLKLIREGPEGADAQDPCVITSMDHVGCAAKQSDEVCFDSESAWIGSEKTEPWWRTADRDELAFLVAQRSLDVVDNCDLPRPQNTNLKREYVNLSRVCHGTYGSSVEPNLNSRDSSNSKIHPRGNLTSKLSDFKMWPAVEDHSQFSAEKSSSGCRKSQLSENDSSRAQLLEALRHSQTRAREAEKAAKQAYAEKEHVVKLVFKQASQLFAYKQWFQLLQLENFYFQIKNNNQPLCTAFPAILPWVPQRSRKSRRNWQKASRGKRPKPGRSRFDMGRYAVVFALGLSLVGAGFFLGWTVGWMLPRF